MGLIIDFEVRGEAFQYDKTGQISTGRLGENGQPESLDYFNITKFPAIMEEYGNKPDTLWIAFPSDNPEDFMTYRCVQWGKNKQTKRVCDRKNFFVRFDQFAGVDTVNNQNRFHKVGENYPCQFPNCKCTVDFNFIAFVLHPMTGKAMNWTPIKFHSTSWEAGRRFLTELGLRQGLIKWHPFKLWVEMHKNGLKRFPVWYLEALDIRNPDLIEDTKFSQAQLNSPQLMIGTGEQTGMEQRTVARIIDRINEVEVKPENLVVLAGLGKELAKTVEKLSERAQGRIREAYTQRQMEIKNSIAASNVFNGDTKK
ncbi:MAG: hypothetical protein WCL06_00035 [Bacteroidota bacterium]